MFVQAVGDDVDFAVQKPLGPREAAFHGLRVGREPLDTQILERCIPKPTDVFLRFGYELIVRLNAVLGHEAGDVGILQMLARGFPDDLI